MSSFTQDLLSQGGFIYAWHPELGQDIRLAEAEDPGSWSDMRVLLDRVKEGSCRWDDWDAPLARKHADLGEVKRRRGRRLYRLYVHAPRAEPGVLTLLAFGWKPDGLVGLIRQNAQIDLA